jgi:hypothetical protein
MEIGKAAQIAALAISGDRWPDEVPLSEIEQQFVCQACGRRAANVRPNFHLAEEARRALVDGAPALNAQCVPSTFR